MEVGDGEEFILIYKIHNGERRLETTRFTSESKARSLGDTAYQMGYQGYIVAKVLRDV